MRIVSFQRIDKKDWDGKTVFEVFSVKGKNEYSQGLYATEELAVKSIAASPMFGGIGRGFGQTPSNSTAVKIVERRLIEDDEE